MPVEIKELTIKVSVGQQSNTGNALVTAPAAYKEEEKQLHIKEAVEEVLRIIESKKER